MGKTARTTSPPGAWGAGERPNFPEIYFLCLLCLFVANSFLLRGRSDDQVGHRRRALDERADARVEVGVDAHQAVERGRELRRTDRVVGFLAATESQGAGGLTPRRCSSRMRRTSSIAWAWWWTPVCSAGTTSSESMPSRWALL